MSPSNQMTMNMKFVWKNVWLLVIRTAVKKLPGNRIGRLMRRRAIRVNPCASSCANDGSKVQPLKLHSFRIHGRFGIKFCLWLGHDSANSHGLLSISRNVCIAPAPKTWPRHFSRFRGTIISKWKSLRENEVFLLILGWQTLFLRRVMNGKAGI